MTTNTTIRIQKSDKERLAMLARKSGNKSLADALRFAIAAGEREMESFEGDPAAIVEALRAAVAIGKRTSERVDEELAEALR